MEIPALGVLQQAITAAFSAQPRAGLRPIPGTRPVTLEAAICPPLVYYVALLFLAPPPPGAVASKSVTAVRNVLALLAAFLFFRLPLAYHIPQSIGFTYQLGLVGLYGGLRVLDACFVTKYLFGHVPRRVKYTHLHRVEDPRDEDTAARPWSDGGKNGHLRRPSAPSLTNDPKPEAASTGRATDSHLAVPRPSRPSLTAQISQSGLVENMTNESYSELASRFFLHGPSPRAVIEHADTETGYPQSFLDRAAWAFELLLSMRGTGFTWTTADVRHTHKTWLPTVGNRVHSLALHVGPILLVSWAVIRTTYSTHIRFREDTVESPFDELLPLTLQLPLVLALGAFLMAAFSLAHSLFAILLSGLVPSPLAFFPPLYTTRVWEVESLREFWSHGWHRLFARLFLVWGTWPGEWIERKLLRKGDDEPADVGKILGAFASSAFVHAFAVRGTLGGSWRWASGEARFFALNGLGVILEEGVRRAARRQRQLRGASPKMWYDAYVGRVYWIGVLLLTGRFFARGWTKAGLVREMAFL